MLAQVPAAVFAAALCVLTAPYLARLTLSVPDRSDATWWRGQSASRRRHLVVAVVALVLGSIAGGGTGVSALLPAGLAVAIIATPLVVIDVEHHRLPNRLVLVLLIALGGSLAFAAAVGPDWHRLVRSAEAGAAVFAVFALIVLLAPRSFGLGDVKLGAALGTYLGWFGWTQVYYGIFAGFVFGAVVSAVLLVSRSVSLKSAVAFGPMLIFGALAVTAAHPATPVGSLLGP